jgi:PPOX class probable F420-dependent enzyme
MKLTDSVARRHFVDSRVAHLATADEDGKPHIVPITFVVVGDQIVHVVDDKPKRSTDLQRIRNITANEWVAVLVDQYDDDWNRLWWSRADGVAEVWYDDRRERYVDLLAEKYPHYRTSRPTGPMIVVNVRRWTGWASA